MKRFAKYITVVVCLLMSSAGSLSAAEYVKATIVETEAGKAWDVNILLRNTSTNYTAFQMDLSLPTGVNYSEGSLTPSSRLASHSVMASTLPDGTLRLLAYSSANVAISGLGEGSILTLKLVADPALTPGDYSVALSNIRFSLRTGVEKNFDDVTATLVASPDVVKSYQLIYMVDGVEFARQTQEAGAAITPLAAPEKEGHTFSGWQNLPEVMPENDVVVTGTFAVNSYRLVYLLEGVEYHEEMVQYGTAITPLAAPEKEGHTFNGWEDLPDLMPAHDVTVIGTFSVNTYVVKFYLDGELYDTREVAYGEAIPLPEVTPADGYAFSGWQEVPDVMPAHDIDIHGTTIDTGIESILEDGCTLKKAVDVYDLNGHLVRRQATTLKGLPRGIYIIGKHKIAVR